jgi:hypothetical protein
VVAVKVAASTGRTVRASNVAGLRRQMFGNVRRPPAPEKASATPPDIEAVLDLLAQVHAQVQELARKVDSLSGRLF